MLNGYLFYLNNIFQIFTKKKFQGWGYKKTGQFAKLCYKCFGGNITLLEDGFVRSIGLGTTNSPSFSLVEDDIGIYYDATSSSKLENLLNTFDFNENQNLINDAKEAIDFIIKHNISKYNNSLHVKDDYFENSDKKRVLVIIQTKNDLSLKYGFGEEIPTLQMLQDAINENQDADIYVKLHPEAIYGKKNSDLLVKDIPKNCKIITENINPIELLKNMDKVYTKTSQMGFEALLLGKECICYGMPFYAGWGLTKDKLTCKRRERKLKVEELFAASYILYTRYHDPYENKPLTLIKTLNRIVEIQEKKLYKNAFFFGFSRWKHDFMKPFFKDEKFEKFIFINPIFKKNYFKKAIKLGLNSDSLVYIWGRKKFEEIENFAIKNSININYVEDGFIRSVKLGSDLTRPYSLVVDDIGIYFDATRESGLENILNSQSFNEKMLEEAKKIREFLLVNQISKYNIFKNKLDISIPKDKNIILVVGQVEDDASIVYGGFGMTNQKLVEMARVENPNSFIIYKAHPDVVTGNRLGKVQDLDKFVDLVVNEVEITDILNQVDEVHTITSLVGFEAILREKKVVTYGMPFYAGWGLSTDKLTCKRRVRKLGLLELIYATLVIYPRYINIKSYETCDIFTFLYQLQQEKEEYNYKNISATEKMRNQIIRKFQYIYRVIKK
ncbi:MAG: capsular polysaccharide biosynthesis protein [Campylobacteraceae bacterium]